MHEIYIRLLFRLDAATPRSGRVLNTVRPRTPLDDTLSPSDVIGAEILIAP